MVTKTIAILANSYKHHERCIAGRELVSLNRRFYLKGWIRPVSGHGGGELDVLETARPGAVQVAMGEIASVRLVKCADDPCQPENWLIAGNYPWDRPAIEFPMPPLAKLEEKPEGLARSGKTDRIPHEEVVANPQGFSICVIRPENLRLICWSEHNAVNRRDDRTVRACFMYRGVAYELSLTDPIALDRYAPEAPASGRRPKTIPLRAESGPLICVSLTPVFNGYHYKVVATILGMPANE